MIIVTLIDKKTNHYRNYNVADTIELLEKLFRDNEHIFYNFSVEFNFMNVLSQDYKKTKAIVIKIIHNI